MYNTSVQCSNTNTNRDLISVTICDIGAEGVENAIFYAYAVKGRRWGLKTTLPCLTEMLGVAPAYQVKEPEPGSGSGLVEFRFGVPVSLPAAKRHQFISRVEQEVAAGEELIRCESGGGPVARVDAIDEVLADLARREAAADRTVIGVSEKSVIMLGRYLHHLKDLVPPERLRRCRRKVTYQDLDAALVVFTRNVYDNRGYVARDQVLKFFAATGDVYSHRCDRNKYAELRTLLVEFGLVEELDVVYRFGEGGQPKRYAIGTNHPDGK